MWILSFVISLAVGGFHLETMPAPDKESCIAAANEVVKITNKDFSIVMASCHFEKVEDI